MQTPAVMTDMDVGIATRASTDLRSRRDDASTPLDGPPQLLLSAGHSPTAVTGGAAIDLTIDDIVTVTARTGILDGGGLATESWALPFTASLSGIALCGQAAVLTLELPLLYALSPAATIVFP